jgi:hypothetical protein
MPDSISDIKKEVHNIMRKNKLTFADNAFNAHFLARRAIMNPDINAGEDLDRNKKRLSAGFDKEGNTSIRGFPVESLDDRKSSEYLSIMMDKAFKNLRKKYSDSQITQLLKYTSNNIYNNNTNESYNSNPRLRDYEKFVEYLKDRPKNTLFSMVGSRDAAPVSNMIATTQSLLSLGLDKSDMFGSMFKYIVDNHDSSLSDTDIDYKEQMSDFITTVERYGGNIGNSLMRDSSSKYLKNAMKMFC